MANDILDQLWYTWSTAGLESMNRGYRVRAASPGLHDMNSLRYRRVDRFLRYELPQGVNLAEFDPHFAPPSLTFVNNGDESLLIHKLFLGRDTAGRYSVHFSHLIAGLPGGFTAREAINLWNNSFWIRSESGKAVNDTQLQSLSSSQFVEYAREAQPLFNFAIIRESLSEMIQIVLTQGLPKRISIVGPSEMIAAYIYGLTHCLPKSRFAGLTFSTYESNPGEGETVIVGTISGAELTAFSPLRIHHISQPLPGAVSPDVQKYAPKYAAVAIQCLIAGDMAPLKKIIDRLEKRDEEANATLEKRGLTTAEDLIELFKRYFERGQLSYKQMLDMVNNPRNEDNREDLSNPIVQQQSADLLLTKPEYWENGGKPCFANAVQKINTPNALDPRTQAALAGFINAVTNLLLDAMKTAVVEARRTSNVDALVFCTHVFSVLAQPKYNRQIWLRLLQEFAQTPLYDTITSATLWTFQVWLLQCAMKMEPPPETSMMMPWLNIPSWEKLGQVLGLGLPTEWENAAIWNLLALPILKTALAVVHAHDAKFRALLQWTLQQQKPEYTEIVMRFFAAMIEHGYPQRVDLLLFLLKVTPKEAHAIDGLLACVPPMTERQLLAREIETLLEGCSLEMIAAANTSQAMTEYLRRYVLSLTLDKIRRENVFLLLKQLNQGGMQPSTIASLVQNWLTIANFLQHSHQLSRRDLEQAGQALQAIMQVALNESGNSREQFINAFIPQLAQKVENEYDLGIILDAFVPSLVGSRWGLLRQLAHEAGSFFAPTKDYSRLTPYLISGLREYAGSNPKPPQTELDHFLSWLFGSVDERVLRSVEEGIFSAMWPEWMKVEWEGWRKRVAPPNFVQKILPGPKRHTGPHSDQPAPVNNAVPPHPAQGYANQSPVQEGKISPARRGFVAHPPEHQRNSPPATQSPPQIPVKVPIAVAYLEAYQNLPIDGDYYRAMHTIMPWVLRYWSTWLTKNKDKSSSKTRAFESSTAQEILNDLQGGKKTEASKYLVNYLVDDWLIDREIKGLATSDPQSGPFLDPNRWVSLRLQELRTFAPELWNQTSWQQYLEQALRMLIRRHHFLQYLEEHKENPKRWIEGHRRDARIKYP